jgi:hypothetical protein
VHDWLVVSTSEYRATLDLQPKIAQVGMKIKNLWFTADNMTAIISVHCIGSIPQCGSWVVAFTPTFPDTDKL